MMKSVLSVFIILTTLWVGCKKENLEEFDSEKEKAASGLFDTVCPPPIPVKDNDPIIAQFFNERHRQGLNGLAMVTRNDTIIYRDVFGYQNYESKDSFRINTAMQLASVSKQFTGVAVLQLVEKNQIKLTDSIQCYFPDFPYTGITVHNLLTHRSGLPNYMYFLEEYCSDKMKPVSNLELVKLMTTNKPDAYANPNSRYQYSNTGYALLAAIVEKVTGLSFEDYMEIYVFRPAGMNNTWVYNKARDPFIKNRAWGYTPGWVRYADDYMNGITGDKGIYSTLNDLFYWDQALDNETILSKEMQELAYTPHNPGMINSNYGYGWRIFKENGHNIAFHFGWWRGFKAFMLRDNDRDLNIVIMTNRENVRLNDLTALFNHLYGNNPPLGLLNSARQG